MNADQYPYEMDIFRSLTKKNVSVPNKKFVAIRHLISIK